MPFGIPELLIVLVIVLLVFGPKRLPSLGRQLGGGMREFKDSITARHDANDDEEQAVRVADPNAGEATGAGGDRVSATPELTPAVPAERPDGIDAFGNPAPVREEPATGPAGPDPREAS